MLHRLSLKIVPLPLINFLSLPEKSFVHQLDEITRAMRTHNFYLQLSTSHAFSDSSLLVLYASIRPLHRIQTKALLVLNILQVANQIYYLMFHITTTKFEYILICPQTYLKYILISTNWGRLYLSCLEVVWYFIYDELGLGSKKDTKQAFIFSEHCQRS